MRIPSTTDNGNVVLNSSNVKSRNINNRRYFASQNNSIITNTDEEDNIQFTNNNILTNDTLFNETVNVLSKTTSEENYEIKICNKQYRLNNQNLITRLRENENQNSNQPTDVNWDENCIDKANDSTNSTPADEERAFEISDSDEMSEKSVHPVPRGIVNPNYPGFQHLAHTLQEYSSNIGSCYNSENEMTDEDLDVEISDSTCNFNRNVADDEFKYINNNKHFDECKTDTKLKNISFLEMNKSDIKSNNDDMPDLLKTISQNNNNIDSVNYDLNCSAIDIENNFHTKDIIGDFNKEIEDEIKQLLNYNINIEDDLEDLRNDIKENFSKPIENTINNISEVVNHVIKKLVENDGSIIYDVESDHINDHEMEDVTDMNKQNESNTRTEMNISRPTFLLIENNIDNKIKDAILSDGKDEINIYEEEYNTEQLSNNVENTIKQLSTELRKIIPKLNEMRERDKLWIENKKELVTDSNSNNVGAGLLNTIQSTSSLSIKQDNLKRNTQDKFMSTNHQRSIKSFIDPKVRHSVAKAFSKAQNIASVRKNIAQKEPDFDSFDVYNIETALPKLDLDAIENHIKAAKEAERRKRNDREEIRKRLAMGVDTEEYYSLGHIDRPGKKPSLHSRLQNGKNLQICFMNETASDNESQASDIERNFNCNSKSSSRSSLFSKNSFNHPYQTRPLSVNITKNDSNTQGGAKLRPTSLTLKSTKSRSTHSLGHIELKESDFFALQATLQTEARIALAQAKEMARIQMERERHARAVSPVTEMLQRSMEKANAPLAPDRRRVSRHLLTDMNIAQLQVIVNELHSQIESLNDSLVKFLMARDELHMGQDSMLVDIEDLTRYLGVKEQTKKTKGTTKSGVKRLTSLVHK
ncbi:putative leucine-rich repeat-containing protein DDB_G0290503 isoform X1 [Bicyclus anynana]|uniref:Leucine-rich repeat-containing protein DDB_G0290503 isoform X1 n=1 Tax=Bicyclus anynana TaxID=110368 RepID=A0A6J1N8B3_BICAN|nr:putative leucine-rich repeat-containing protein DDB_G0290503 isoform X1 [Bicyclus anynana]XP_023943956.2 putative leucine-rich repeat-containing protein DDB_G0290503 isoform X1 [Bicyclus anynana]